MAPAPYRLVVHAGPNPGTVFELARDVAMVGRDVTNEIVLGDPEISRQHARFTRTPAGYVIEDLGSTNGTFVNGERLAGPRGPPPAGRSGLGRRGPTLDPRRLWMPGRAGDLRGYRRLPGFLLPECSLWPHSAAASSHRVLASSLVKDHRPGSHAQTESISEGREELSRWSESLEMGVGFPEGARVDASYAGYT